MITILIPTTRRSRLLERTLDSLARSRFPEEVRELVVVENGPRGEAEKLLHAKEFPIPVRFLHLDRANKSHALNRVIETLPPEEWILFLDDDIRLEEEVIEAYAEAVREAQERVANPKLYFGGPVGVDRESEPPEWMEPLLPFSARGADLENTRPALGYLGCNWMAQVRSIREQGGFNESLGPGAPGGASGQESEMMYRFEAAGYRPVDVPEALVWHYVPAERVSEDWLDRRFENYGASLARSDRGMSPARARRELLKYVIRYAIYALLRNRLEKKRSELEIRTRRTYLREKSRKRRSNESHGTGKTSRKDQRPILGFFYYTYYPVRGGASLHGAKLAEGLHQRGHRLVKLNGDPDPWSERWPTTPWHALNLLFKAEKIYARADFFLNGRNLLISLALLSGKKVVVELNCPSDELRMKGAGEQRIRWTDRVAGFLLRRACTVVVVSEAVGRYAREALHLTNTRVIENGGEGVTQITKPQSVLYDEQTRSFMQKHRTLALWTGTPTGLQSTTWVRELARRCPELGIVMAVNEEPGTEVVVAEEKNVCIFRNRSREEVRDLVHRARIGLAFYEPMPWSRWGFYLSPLKVPEFLNSGLHVITNAPGSPAQRACPGYHEITSPEEAARVAKKLMDNPFDRDGSSTWPLVRTWDDVANEVDQILKSC